MDLEDRKREDTVFGDTEMHFSASNVGLFGCHTGSNRGRPAGHMEKRYAPNVLGPHKPPEVNSSGHRQVRLGGNGLKDGSLFCKAESVSGHGPLSLSLPTTLCNSKVGVG
jgi:hypothetical protein